MNVSTASDGRKASVEDRRWKIFLVALSLFTLALTPINVWQKFVLFAHEPVSVAAQTQSTGVPFVWRVTASQPGSELEKGDIVDLRSLTSEERYRLANQVWVAGEVIKIPAVRGHSSRVLIARAVKDFIPIFKLTPHSAAFWLAQIALLLIPLFAMVLSLKPPGSVEVRYLAFFLIFRAMETPADDYNWLTPWIGLDVIMASIGVAANSLFLIFIALYASLFGAPSSLLRRVLCMTTIALAVAEGVFFEALTIGPLGTSIDVSQLPPFVSQLAYCIPAGAALATILTAALAAKGAERARAIWATASLTPTLAVDLVSYAFASVVSISDEVQLIAGNTSLFILLVGLSYALFNRRLLDIGFALNRATVFAALSLLVFGAFNLTEWALGGWLSTLNRTTNAALSATLALALGLSLKPLHDAVERIVDRTLFRKRNEAERALRAFAHEAAFYTDSTTLIGAATSAIAKHAETASTALILERDGNFDGLEPDDAALVALRAWQRRLDLHTVPSALSGEYAFPLIVRGKLTGVLAIGPKRSVEPYAPDELDAIDRIALAVGIALDGLDRAPERSNDRSVALFESVEATMNALADRMLTLAGAIDTLAGRMEPATGATGNRAAPPSLSTTAPPS